MLILTAVQNSEDVLTRFWFALCYRSVVCPLCPVCDVGALWPNGCMDQDETRQEVGLGPGHIALDGDPAPPPQKGTAPNFRPMSIVAKRSPISATAEPLLSVVRIKRDISIQRLRIQ